MNKIIKSLVKNGDAPFISEKDFNDIDGIEGL